mmetsp:Transcript_164542/g.527787  ORF Transcript_164542/g.527787 Transcript_164542/m.527787 type:complete len:293 (+) Transcript_164542:402-1280(+)
MLLPRGRQVALLRGRAVRRVRRSALAASDDAGSPVDAGGGCAGPVDGGACRAPWPSCHRPMRPDAADVDRCGGSEATDCAHALHPAGGHQGGPRRRHSERSRLPAHGRLLQAGPRSGAPRLLQAGLLLLLLLRWPRWPRLDLLRPSRLLPTARLLPLSRLLPAALLKVGGPVVDLLGRRRFLGRRRVALLLLVLPEIANDQVDFRALPAASLRTGALLEGLNNPSINFLLDGSLADVVVLQPQVQCRWAHGSRMCRRVQIGLLKGSHERGEALRRDRAVRQVHLGREMLLAQ